MCLAVPGKIVAMSEGQVSGAVGAVGTVDFQGSQLEVSLAMTPEARMGDWVLVHAGYAISIMEAEEARETWEYLEFEGVGEVPSELKSGEPSQDE